jgi:hypothetical protein
MFGEAPSARLLPMGQFLRRLWRSSRPAAVIVAGSLGIGILGYHHFEHLSWLDSLLNASMILSSEGPVTPLQTDAGKWFASFYALFSGVVFISVISILSAPIAHRLLHQFHLELDGGNEVEAPDAVDQR